MNRSFWIIALVNFINALSVTILIPVIYQYSRSFNLSDGETGLLFAIFSIAQFFATPILGKLSDRFGRRPLLIISLLGTVIANILAGTATTAWLLFLARFLDGITGGNISVAQSVISDVTTPETRAKGFGIAGASLGMGFVLGPAISLSAQKISLGASFLVAAAIAAIALLITIFYLPETLPSTARSTKGKLFNLGLKDLVIALTYPRVGVLFILNFFIGTTFSLFTFALQPYYLSVLKQDNQSLTLLFLAIGVVSVIVQTLGIQKLTKRMNLVNVLFLGLFFRSLSFVMMPIFPDIYHFLLAIFLFCIFNSIVQPTVSTLISLATNPQEQGKMAGLNSSYLSLANGIGPMIAAAMVDAKHPLSYGYPLYAAGLFTGIVLLFALRDRAKFATNI
jgi:predicted MFS family arabinose efflux permease